MHQIPCEQGFETNSASPKIALCPYMCCAYSGLHAPVALHRGTHAGYMYIHVHTVFSKPKCQLDLLDSGFCECGFYRDTRRD